MIPPPAVAAERSSSMWGHMVKHGSLLDGARRVGSDTVLSPVLSAPSSVLTDRLLGKMNVMMGFDYPFYIGHHTGGHLGNFVKSDQGPQNLRNFPTIDQVLAWSDKFYPDLAGIKERSAVTGYDFRGISWGWSNPENASGDIIKVPVVPDTLTLFDQLFRGATVPPPPSGEPPPPKRPLVVDRILNSYKSLRESNRRLSTEDRRRLDDHVAALAELQRRVTDTGGGGKLKMCDTRKPARGSNGQIDRGEEDSIQAHSLLNDVIAMAFACGVTRVATIHIVSNFANYSGDWHQNVAHQHTTPTAQALMVPAMNKTFRASPLDLAAKLDQFEESPGVSLLDSCLIQWTQESGPMTHEAIAMTNVTFGSARGYFETGRFVDFRAKPNKGVLHRQWLATVLQSMGLSPADFEYGGKPGYGDAHVDNDFPKQYAPAILSAASQPLPVVTKL